MTNTYQWSVVEAEYLTAPITVAGQQLSQVISLIRFKVTVSDGTNSVDYFDQIALPLPTDPASFVPANQTTRAMLIQWASAVQIQTGTDDSGNPVYVSLPAFIKAKANAALAAKVAPTTQVFIPAS